jgi:hypothetical protein
MVGRLTLNVSISMIDEYPYEAPQKGAIDRPARGRTRKRRAALWRRRTQTARFVAREAFKVLFLLACACAVGVAILYFFFLPPINP